MKRVSLFPLFLLVGLLAFPTLSMADQVKAATAQYLRGMSQFKGGQYGAAISSFGRAHRMLPAHPHFNCHRTSFLNYQGRAYESLRKPFKAMRIFYQAAYRSGCGKSSLTGYAAGRYKSLYARWMSTISLRSTPPKARIFLMVGGRDKLITTTPHKKVYSPGTYKFKIRLYDHKTQYYTVRLRPGMHVKKNFIMVKGEDPINRPEKVDVAPPPPMAAAGTNSQDGTAPAPANPNKPKKISLGQDLGTGEKGLTTDNTVKEDDPLLSAAKKPKGPPIYKQTWFWVTIGAVAAGSVAVVFLIPKEQQFTMSQGTLF